MIEIFMVTPFPQMVEAVIGESILRRAETKGFVRYRVIDLRDFAEGKYRQVDDYPFGGGSGMVMKAEPILKAVQAGKDLFSGEGDLRVILPTPQGEILNQTLSWTLSQTAGLIFICGHYKGIDERVCEMVVTDEISIGDYVVTGGELPAMVVLDSIVRLVPGVLGNHESAITDSFTFPLLDHPHYTRPEELQGKKVPEVLLSGHHLRIQTWRQKQREKRTQERRPDLWKRYRKENSKLGV